MGVDFFILSKSFLLLNILERLLNPVSDLGTEILKNGRKKLKATLLALIGIIKILVESPQID